MHCMSSSLQLQLQSASQFWLKLEQADENSLAESLGVEPKGVEATQAQRRNQWPDDTRVAQHDKTCMYLHNSI